MGEPIGPESAKFRTSLGVWIIMLVGLKLQGGEGSV